MFGTCTKVQKTTIYIFWNTLFEKFKKEFYILQKYLYLCLQNYTPNHFRSYGSLHCNDYSNIVITVYCHYSIVSELVEKSLHFDISHFQFKQNKAGYCRKKWISMGTIHLNKTTNLNILSYIVVRFFIYLKCSIPFSLLLLALLFLIHFYFIQKKGINAIIALSIHFSTGQKLNKKRFLINI